MNDILTFSSAQIWLFMAIILIVMELFSMSLYLLVIALGFLVGSFFAYIAMPVYVQVVMSCLTIMIGLFLLDKFKKSKKNIDPINTSPNQLDIGARVWVESAIAPIQVTYKGAIWQARVVVNNPSANVDHAIDASEKSLNVNQPAWYIIKNIDRNVLILTKANDAES
jgi:membrane protein implicated in regulation of membrane protease activity